MFDMEQVFLNICPVHHCSNSLSLSIFSLFYSQFEEASRVTSVEILNGNYDQKRKRLNGAVVNNLIYY